MLEIILWSLAILLLLIGLLGFFGIALIVLIFNAVSTDYELEQLEKGEKP
jgi:hypothetical protein